MPKYVSFKGDKKIEARLKAFSKAAQIFDGYDVGFMDGTRYLPEKGSKEQPPTTAQVAFENEFGTKNAPARPFFQIANQHVQSKLVKLLTYMLSARSNFVLSYQDFFRLAQVHEAEVKTSITELREPPNSSETIARKKKRQLNQVFENNPLIDTGLMRKSVTSKVVK